MLYFLVDLSLQLLVSAYLINLEHNFSTFTPTEAAEKWWNLLILLLLLKQSSVFVNLGPGPIYFSFSNWEGRGWPLPILWKSRYHGISSTSSHYIALQEYLRISTNQTPRRWNDSFIMKLSRRKNKIQISLHRNERKPLKHFSGPFISRTWWLKKIR